MAYAAVENARLRGQVQEANMRAERATARLVRLQAIAAALSMELEPANVARVIVAEGAAALGAAAGWLARLTEGGAFLEPLAATGVPGGNAHGPGPLALHAPLPICDAVRSARPVWLESPEAVT